MTRLASRLFAPVLLFASLAVGAPANAQDLAKEAFYGHFQGSGVAENSDSLYFGVTVRDLDVQIGPEAPGFYVEWTSVIRGGGDTEDQAGGRHDAVVGTQHGGTQPLGAVHQVAFGSDVWNLHHAPVEGVCVRITDAVFITLRPSFQKSAGRIRGFPDGPPTAPSYSWSQQ